MKGKKKEMAVNISEIVQDKLKDSAGEPEKLKEAIKRMAKKLAEKVVRFSVKQDKKLKKIKEPTKPVIKAEKKKKQKIQKGLKGVDTTERELLLTDQSGKTTKKKK